MIETTYKNSMTTSYSVINDRKFLPKIRNKHSSFNVVIWHFSGNSGQLGKKKKSKLEEIKLHLQMTWSFIKNSYRENLCVWGKAPERSKYCRTHPQRWVPDCVVGAAGGGSGPQDGGDVCWGLPRWNSLVRLCKGGCARKLPARLLCWEVAFWKSCPWRSNAGCCCGFHTRGVYWESAMKPRNNTSFR
jgi:hypothetical protein